MRQCSADKAKATACQQVKNIGNEVVMLMDHKDNFKSNKGEPFEPKSAKSARKELNFRHRCCRPYECSRVGARYRFMDNSRSCINAGRIGCADIIIIGGHNAQGQGYTC